VLLGVTGSIAGVQGGLLARLLVDAGADVRVILTHSAERFVGADTFAAITAIPCRSPCGTTPGEVVHVHLAHDIDVAVVAPATANVDREARDGDRRRPASRSTLLETTQPVDRRPGDAHRHVAASRDGRQRGHARRSGVRCSSGPVVGALAAGDEVPRATRRTRGHLPGLSSAPSRSDTSGRDPDRRHRRTDPRADRPGAHSSGTARRGRWASRSLRSVVAGRGRPLILGPDTVPAPPGVTALHVETAEEMHRAVVSAAGDADVVVMGRGRRRFRPNVRGRRQAEEGVRHAGVSSWSRRRTSCGSSANTRGRGSSWGSPRRHPTLESAGRGKLRAKHLDMVVVNEGRFARGPGSVRRRTSR
jgi:phosphopantothenoylcysteine decarboxylase/phosphopantothenate--cysteine ligase